MSDSDHSVDCEQRIGNLSQVNATQDAFHQQIQCIKHQEASHEDEQRAEHNRQQHVYAANAGGLQPNKAILTLHI